LSVLLMHALDSQSCQLCNQ